MPVLSIILAAVQWLILIIFLLVGVFSGTRRGFKKTYFYVVTNLLLTIGVIFLISIATIRWIFPTAGALVEFASKYLSLDQNTMDYLTNPNISPVIFALIDVVFKILLFIVVYPIVKLLFNLLVVKPLWYLFFKGKKDKINKKAYREYGVVVKEKRHLSKSSRFLG